MMHRIRHEAVVDLLTEKLIHASEGYPVRTYKTESDRMNLFQKETDVLETDDLKLSETGNATGWKETSVQYYEKILLRAMERKAELESRGMQVTLVREEPFTTAQDSVEYNVYLMIWKKKWGNHVVEVERIS